MDGNFAASESSLETVLRNPRSQILVTNPHRFSSKLQSVVSVLVSFQLVRGFMANKLSGSRRLRSHEDQNSEVLICFDTGFSSVPYKSLISCRMSSQG